MSVKYNTIQLLCTDQLEPNQNRLCSCFIGRTQFSPSERCQYLCKYFWGGPSDQVFFGTELKSWVRAYIHGAKEKLLGNINPHKAKGPDEIHGRHGRQDGIWSSTLPSAR